MNDDERADLIADFEDWKHRQQDEVPDTSPAAFLAARKMSQAVVDLGRVVGIANTALDALKSVFAEGSTEENNMALVDVAIKWLKVIKGIEQ